MRPTLQTFRKHDRDRELPRWARVMVRRLRVSASSAVAWVLEGLRDHEGNVERQTAEVFSGIGVFARPKGGHRAEAIVIKVGGDGHAAVVATRNHDALKAVEAAGGAIAADESVLFNSLAWVRVKADGTVDICAPGGAAVALATKADVQALRDWAAGHLHTGVTTGAGTSGAPSTTPSSPVGTSKLRAQ